jgi:hypothetical protein
MKFYILLYKIKHIYLSVDPILSPSPGKNSRASLRHHSMFGDPAETSGETRKELADRYQALYQVNYRCITQGIIGVHQDQ